jgi:hypothetical protein
VEMILIRSETWPGKPEPGIYSIMIPILTAYTFSIKSHHSYHSTFPISSPIVPLYSRYFSSGFSHGRGSFSSVSVFGREFQDRQILFVIVDLLWRGMLIRCQCHS